MEATLGWRADLSSLPGDGVRIGISDGGRPASVQSVLNALQTDPTVGSWFGACLAALPWRAFYWECPALTPAALSDPFECVALERCAHGPYGGAAGVPRPSDAAPPGSLVAVFPTLGGDAVLVAPTEADEGGGYPHLAAFLRAAPQAQIAAYFSAFASEARRSCRKGPHGSAPPGMVSRGCTAVWKHRRSTM